MTNMKRTNLEVAGGLILLASGYVIRWWQTRNDVPNAVKNASAAKDKEHAEDLRRFEEQRQKEIQMYRTFIDYFVNNKEQV